MARPTRITINAGDNSWEAQVNTNLQQLYDRPIPIHQLVDDLAALETAFPAASYAWCMAIVEYDSAGTPGNHLAFSNGTAWKLASNWELMNRAVFRGITGADSWGDLDDTIVVTGASNFALTLPAISDANEGRRCRLKHNGTGDVTVTPTGGDTIDGAGTKLVDTQYQSFDFISDGTGDWQIFGGSGAGGGASDFVGLTDTPANFSGDGGKTLKVNVGETAVEFVDITAGRPGGPLKFMSRGHVAADVDQTIGTSDTTVELPTALSSAGSAVSWVDANDEFLINETGTYLLMWQMQTDDGTVHNVVGFLEKDPLGIGSYASIEETTGFQGFAVRNSVGKHAIVQLNATDLIRLRARDLSTVGLVTREGTSVSIIKLDVSLASGGDMEVFQQGLELAETHTLGAAMAVVDLASPVINNNTDLYSFDAGTDVLTLNEEGLYMISYTMAVSETSGTLETAAKLQKDIGAGYVDIEGSESTGSGAADFTHGNTVLISLAATDQIKLMAQYTTSAGDAVAGTMLRVVRLKRGSTSIDYSTAEQDTGQLYHDGKKIYQKTIVFGAMPNTTTKTVAHNITGLGYVLQMWGVADNGTSQLPISYVVTSAIANQLALLINDTNVSIQAGSNLSAYSGDVTMRYTKA